MCFIYFKIARTIKLFLLIKKRCLFFIIKLHLMRVIFITVLILFFIRSCYLKKKKKIFLFNANKLGFKKRNLPREFQKI